MLLTFITLERPFMRPTRVSLSLLVGLLTCAAALTTTIDAPARAQPERNVGKYAARLGPSLEQIVREEKIPGLAVGIVEDGRLVYARGFGVRKLGDPATSVTAETLFHMASITKPFVATAVMQLVEQGKVDLDAPVTRYLPYFRLKDPRHESITVRQMLTHTSGMPDVEDYQWDKPEDDEGSLERYVRSLSDHELRWQPGSRFAYSNMAYEVLGDLVAKVSGTSFEDYVAARILKPLGMRSSTLLLKRADPGKLAIGYTRTKDGAVKPIAHYPYNRAHTPSSNLHSNVEDMARWALANLNHGELDGRRILERSTHDLMWKPGAETGQKGVRIGISWFLEESRGDRLVVHGGGDDGFLTYLWLCPDRKIGVIFMANSDYGPPMKRVREIIISTALGREDGK
jgi:CubicO group peptidase (beta-lactamase class C family)